MTIVIHLLKLKTTNGKYNKAKNITSIKKEFWVHFQTHKVGRAVETLIE